MEEGGEAEYGLGGELRKRSHLRGGVLPIAIQGGVTPWRCETQPIIALQFGLLSTRRPQIDREVLCQRVDQSSP